MTLHQRMEQLTVSTTTEGLIEISQESSDPESADSVIKLSPDQVDVLNRWLVEAKEQLKLSST